MFIIIGKEYIVFKVGIKGILNVKWIVDDIIEIEESDYYIYVALLYLLEDKVFFFEEFEFIVDNDLNEREDEIDK